MNILDQAIGSASAQTNGLTDGQITCSYQEIPEIFAGIERRFAEAEIGQEDCLALESINSVPNALLLLYLLSKGYNFLLSPKAANGPPLPKFCRYAVVAESLTADGNPSDLREPSRFLTFLQQEEWIQESGRTDSPDSRLYLRTSGSTGRPKLAVHSHGKLLGNALNCVERLGLNSGDRIAIPVPITHMYGLGAAFLPAVAVGAAIDLQPGANLLRYLQRETQFVPNVAFMTPVFCETLLKGRKSERAYKLTVAAGDRMKEETFAEFESRFGCLVKLYGSTEMGAIAASSPDDPRELRGKTVGKPMTGVRLRLAEETPESGADPDGLGELWCQHEYGFAGYVDDQGKPHSQNLPSQGNWFSTRDLGRIGADGRVDVFGRCDHSVNRNGLLVFFADVEKAMETLEGIEQVVVIAKGESQRGKGLAAYCVLTKDATLTASDIRSACFDVLPRHGIPDLVFIIDSLPLLPNGKVDRMKLSSRDDVVNPSK